MIGCSLKAESALTELDRAMTRTRQGVSDDLSHDDESMEFPPTYRGENASKQDVCLCVSNMCIQINSPSHRFISLHMLPLVVATLLACSAMCVADPLKGVEWLVAQGRHGYPVEYYVEPVIETRGGHFTVCESGPAVEPFERWLRYTAGYYGTSERPVANAFVHVIMGDSSQETFQVKVNSKDKESPCFSPTEVTSEAYYHKFLADLNEICTDNAFRMHKAGGPGILVGRYFGAIDHGQQTLELELDHGSLSAASTNGIQGALQFMGFGDAFVYASVKGHDSIRMMILRRNPPSDSEHRRIGRENLETWDHIKAPIGIFHTRIHRVRHG